MTNFNESGLSMRSSLLSNSTLSLSNSPGGWFVMDVAGKDFRAMKATLGREPGSIFARMIEDDVDPDQLTEEFGIISFDPNTMKWNIEGSPDYFDYILKYMRTGKFNGVKLGHTLEDLIDEAEMYKLDKLVEICRQRIMQQEQMMRSQQQQNQLPISPPPGLYPMPPQQMGPPPGFETKLQMIARQQIPAQRQQQRVFQDYVENSGQQMYSASEINFNMMETDMNTYASNSNRPSQQHTPCSANSEHAQEDELSQFSLPTERISSNNLPTLEETGLLNTSDETMKMEAEDIWAEVEDEEQEDVRDASEPEGDGATDIGQTDFYEEAENVTAAGEEFKQHDIGSTIFTPPANYCPLIDLSSTGEANRRPMVPAFELRDGLVHNFGKIADQRRRFMEHFLKSLENRDKNFVANNIDTFQGNLGNVVFYLQRLYLRYMEGCTINEYVNYENEMKMMRQTQKRELLIYLVPTVVSLLHTGALLTMNENGKLVVCEQVTNVHLFCLRENLCSNLFRYLKRREQAKIKDVIAEMKNMVPSGSHVPGPECLLSIINRYPVIFVLNSDQQTNYHFESAKLSLNPTFMHNDDLAWRLVLDSDVSNMGVEFCDCGQCSA